MFRKKVYGASQVLGCPFCGKTAITKNPQAVPVCTAHTKVLMDDLKCVCGSWLDIREGKYGAFCLCFKCGPMNLNKALEINGGAKIQQETPQVRSLPQGSRSTAENRFPSRTHAAGVSYEKTDSYANTSSTPRRESKKEIVVRSDELDFL